MKHATTICLAALAGSAAAFPAVLEMDMLAKRAEGSKFTKHSKALNGRAPGFNAQAQYVSNTGVHRFIAPSSTDLRGPCPGLNAMANHGYLPHNGYANINQFTQGTYEVFGMGLDLGGFLAVYGSIFDGELTAWSIGGPPPASITGPLTALLGPSEGISGSHNKYEGDVSPTRGDLYEIGNNYEVVLSQFQQLYEYQATVSNEESNYDLQILTDFRAKRFQQSIDNNPYFFNGPFSGVLVQPAAYTFIYRFMGNKSAEHPEGVLTQEVLKDFFAITGDYPNFSYTPGWEKIPDNWYKRAIGDEYTIPFFLTDVLAAALQYPQFLSIGGNLGQTNTFAGLDLEDLTGGVLNVLNIAEGNNLSCFLYQLIILALPDIVDNLLNDVSGVLSTLTNSATQAFDLGCSNLNMISQNQFNTQIQQYPGWTELKSDGTY